VVLLEAAALKGVRSCPPKNKRQTFQIRSHKVYFPFLRLSWYDWCYFILFYFILFYFIRVKNLLTSVQVKSTLERTIKARGGSGGRL
jgi:hypothetical protein